LNRKDQTFSSGVLVLIVILIAFGAMLAAALLLSGGHTQAASVTPTPVEGNPTCTALQGSQTWNQLKVDPPGAGNFSDNDLNPGPLQVTISNLTATTFDWTANSGVDAVFVKGGPEGNLYSYNPEQTSDTGLTTTINPNNEQRYGISHILFCYDPDPAPTPTPTPTATATPPGATATPTATATAVPTATLGQTQAPSALPATGDEPGGDNSSPSALLLALGGLAILGGVGALAAAARRRR